MYDLELKNVIAEIKAKKAKRVLLQLPDGLKPKAREIVDEIERQTRAEALIWLTSCYGACDLPQGLETLRIDLLIQYGHNLFKKDAEGW
ncbi:MAG TPA: diphthamide synthesis protein [Candidatus Nanoarchaeia archaeon]|nr:diphthamide synthesis protein [Candidatus Nanoarchaeia archaeon]